MLITQLSTTPDGPPQPLQRQELWTPMGGTAGVYRRVLNFRLPTGGMAEGIELGEGAAFRGTYQKLEYDALTVGEPSLRATKSSKSGGVLVTLDAPRRVTGIHLTESKAAAGQTLELYRLDGDTPAQDPSETATRLLLQVGVQEEMEAPFVTAPSTGSAPGDGGIMFFEASSAGFGGGVGGPGPGGFASPGGLDLWTGTGFAVDFTDRRFLVRLTDSSGGAVSLGPGDITGLTIRTYPTNPRIGIAATGEASTPTVVDPDAAVFVWRADGEVGNTTPGSAGAVDLGEEMRAEIGRQLGRLRELLLDAQPDDGGVATLPAQVDVAIVLESDAPCAFEPSAPSGGPEASLEYRLLRESFADGAEKQILRFPAGQITTRSVDVPFPPGIQVIHGAVTMESSVAKDRDLDGPLEAGDPGGPFGVTLRADRWAAQPISLSSARTVTRVGLGVVPIARRTELMVEIREDASGSSGGRILSSVRFMLDAVGTRRWSVIPLPTPVVVSTAPHWLVVGTASGSAVLLTEGAADNLRLVRRDGDGRVTEQTGLEGTRALHSLLTGSGGAAALPGFSFGIGDHPVVFAADDTEIDFSAILLAYLEDTPTAGSIPLGFSAVGPGTITVYPPRFVYDLV